MPASNLTPDTQSIQTAKVADLVVDFVRRQGGGVTFVELVRHLDGIGFPASGDAELQMGDLNIVVWSGVSPQFGTLMRELQESQRIEPTPTGMLTYLLDGAVLSYPIAKRPPIGGYVSKRWLPMVLNLPKPRKGRRGKR